MNKQRITSKTSSSNGDGDEEQRKFGSFTRLDNQPFPSAPAPPQLSPISSISTFGSLFNPENSSISCVPSEILVKIFKYFTAPRDFLRYIQVSREWCKCCVELLWQEPCLRTRTSVVKMSRVLGVPQQTFTYARFIRRLDLSDASPYLESDGFMQFLHCDRLKYLNLNGSRITDGALVNFVHTAGQLQDIELERCSKVTDDGILALSRGCPLLRRVRLRNVRLITDAAVAGLAKSCPLLEEIDLGSCARVTDLGVRGFWKHSTQMRVMCLFHCSALTDNAFPALPGTERRAQPDIDFFNPSSSWNETGKAPLPPLTLNHSFDHMRELDLTECPLITDVAIEGIIHHAPKIQSLSLFGCGRLTDRAVQAISKLGTSLDKLDLGYVNKITDSSIRLLARSCTELRFVELTECTLLTDISVVELSTLHKLCRIDLGGVKNLTDEAVYVLADHAPTLEHLYLCYCDQITVMAIVALLRSLHKLEYLSLAGSSVFDDDELQRRYDEGDVGFSLGRQMASCVFSGIGLGQLQDFLEELNREGYEFEE